MVFSSKNLYFLIYANFVNPGLNIKLFKKQLFENIHRLLVLCGKLKVIVSISIYRIASTYLFLNYSPLAQSQQHKNLNNTCSELKQKTQEQGPLHHSAAFIVNFE